MHRQKTHTSKKFPGHPCWISNGRAPSLSLLCHTKCISNSSTPWMMGMVNMFKWLLIRFSTARQSYFVSQYDFSCSIVFAGTPYAQASSSGRSRPGGMRAVATRLLMKDSSSSETEIWNGLGSDTSGFVVDAMVEYSRLSLSRVTKFKLTNWLMKEMEGLAVDKESSRREGETRVRLTINLRRASFAPV